MSRLSFSREPAVWVGAVVSVLTVAADFGLHLTRGQWDHIVAAVPLVAAVLIRSQVTPATGAQPAVNVADLIAAELAKSDGLIAAGQQSKSALIDAIGKVVAAPVAHADPIPAPPVVSVPEPATPLDLAPSAPPTPAG